MFPENSVHGNIITLVFWEGSPVFCGLNGVENDDDDQLLGYGPTQTADLETALQQVLIDITAKLLYQVIPVFVQWTASLSFSSKYPLCSIIS